LLSPASIDPTILSDMGYLSILVVVILTELSGSVTSAFAPQSPAQRSLSSSSLYSGPLDAADDSAIQWELFRKHHAKGSWKGIWTSFNYIGDVIDETVASVDLQLADDDTIIQQTHNIVVGAKRSDCATCFDSFETKEIPVATYAPDNLQKSRMAACSMVNGPSLLRSGAMATELVLSHRDSRVRVIFQHAPVWEAGVEPGSCPPQGLKLFRCMISREALRSTAPTAESEAADPPTGGNPSFYRPVPPFDWHKKWGGTSWTWGPQAGNRGWSLAELDERDDSWHGFAPVETWNLRLPGGIFVQSPRVITDDQAGLCRLAWLPDSDTLLRVETGVVALQPTFLEDETLAGFEPPSLASLRCDVLENSGDLDGEPSFVRREVTPSSINEGVVEADDASTDASLSHSKTSTKGSSDDDSALRAIRDAMSL
jgi:hypothetical protein